MPHSDLQRPRLLVVDDEDSNRRLAERILGSNGYEVAVAASGEEALTLIAVDRPGFDLFILDVMMPGMRGTELAEHIRSNSPRAKILFFTAFSNRLFEDTRVLDSNAAFLDKPASKRDLLEAVSMMLFQNTQGRPSSDTP